MLLNCRYIFILAEDGMPPHCQSVADVNIDIPKSRIEKIYCNDLKNIFGKPKRIFQIVIKNKEGLHTSFRLKDYETGGEFIDKLETLNVILAGYENEMVIDHDEE